MPGFADSFWTPDYAAGLGVLFDKLQQGIAENEQVLTVARLRAEAEEQYGKKLSDIESATDKIKGGFQRDDGASVKKAYDGVRNEMNQAATSHKKIAANISELVVIPFGRWCAAHENRVLSSQDDLQARIKAYDRQADTTRKLRSTYFNKCRQAEDLEEENKLGFQEPEKAESSSPKAASGSPTSMTIPEIVETQDESIEIGDEVYDPEQVKKLLLAIMGSIKMSETKVAILGTYNNTSSGADIVEWIQKNMGATNVGYAEQIGQDLIRHGFLRLVGNVGSTFANSSKMMYQWRPKAFQTSGMPEKKGIDRTMSAASTSSDGTVFGSMNEMLGNVQKWNPLDNPYPNDTPYQRMQREKKDADDKYKAGVRKLDQARCQLEEAIIDHLRFMEKCELDRLKAIKSVVLDFSGAVSNVMPSLQSTVDNMLLYQESVQPLADVRYLVENYRTGGFIPKVPTYDNYYNKIDDQTFGVDLEARARSDRKRVPTIVTTILTFLDSHYPDLDGDEARRAIWLVDVPLAATHHLRNQVNNGMPIAPEMLEKYEIPIVASALKLYLLELPDSLVSFQVYEIMKTVYSSAESSGSAETRVSVLQNTLGQLRLANIATLDAIMTHFTRLIELTSADEAFVTTLSQSLSPCILRPRAESALTMNDRHPTRLVRDLLDHKEAIFGELKRASSHNMNAGPASLQQARNRAPSSSDEHNRRAHMEERARAIAEQKHRSRYSSPSPNLNASSTNGTPGRIPIHKRERSVGAAETRFPVVGSPTVTSHAAPTEGSPNRPNARSRHSLEVPGSRPSSLAKDDGLLTTESPSSAQTQERGAFADTTSATFIPGRDLDPTNFGFSGDVATESLPEDPVANGINEHSSYVAYNGANPSSTGAEYANNVASDGGRDAAAGTAGIKKTDSLGRAGAVAARINRKAAGSVGSMSGSAALKRGSAGSLKSLTEHTRGVQLEDKPMID